MDIDFHFYGTYVAACLAEYRPEEALIIAQAAQYVDDSIRARLSEKRLGFEPIPTAHTTEELLKGNITGDPSPQDLRNTWLPFHFLPGNYKSIAHSDPQAAQRMVTYDGVTVYFPPWSYNKRAQWQFKLLCLPKSPLVTAMINDTINNHKGQSYELHLTGLRMHVHADTGAHMYYAGTPAWHANDAGSPVYDVVNRRNIPFTWAGVIPGTEPATPPAPSYESYCYHGHGRMGHVPDYPWIVYNYMPCWHTKFYKWPFWKWLTKDNPVQFMQRFKEMATALKCIREGRPYSVLVVDDRITAAVEPVVDRILRKTHDYGLQDCGDEIRSNEWRQAILNGAFGRIPLPSYNADIWHNAVKQQPPPFDNTDYWKFNKAALLHFNFVKYDLANEGISMEHE